MHIIQACKKSIPISKTSRYHYSPSNRHNVSGKHLSATTGEPNFLIAHIFSNPPNKIGWLRAHLDLIESDRRSNPLFTARFLSENRFTLFGKRSKNRGHLYDHNDRPLLHEHPSLGARADFVALAIDLLRDLPFYPIDVITLKREIAISPAENVSVLGFPMGKAAGGSFTICVSSFTAFEPDINYNNLPIFLIDCRTKQGQSGSPVFTIKKGMISYKDGSSEIKI